MKMNNSSGSAQAPVMSRRLFLSVGTAAAASAALSACGGGGDDQTVVAAAPAPTPNPAPSTPIETCIPGNNTFAVEAGKSKTISF
jgi:hypothetical protein